MQRFTYLFRAQLVSLRAFVSPAARLASRPCQHGGWPMLPSSSRSEARHSRADRLRCYASIAETDLSPNAIKRRAEGLAGRVGDAVQVRTGCFGRPALALTFTSPSPQFLLT